MELPSLCHFMAQRPLPALKKFLFLLLLLWSPGSVHIAAGLGSQCGHTPQGWWAHYGVGGHTGHTLQAWEHTVGTAVGLGAGL